MNGQLWDIRSSARQGVRRSGASNQIGDLHVTRGGSLLLKRRAERRMWPTVQ